MEKIGAARVVPPHNPQATQPHQAYRLGAMFPEQVMAALNVGQLLHAAEKSEDRDRLRDRQLVRPDASGPRRHLSRRSIHSKWLLLLFHQLLRN